MLDPANQAVVNAEQVEIGPNTDVTKQGASTGKCWYDTWNKRE